MCTDLYVIQLELQQNVVALKIYFNRLIKICPFSQQQWIEVLMRHKFKLKNVSSQIKINNKHFFIHFMYILC